MDAILITQCPVFIAYVILSFRSLILSLNIRLLLLKRCLPADQNRIFKRPFEVIERKNRHGRIATHFFSIDDNPLIVMLCRYRSVIHITLLQDHLSFDILLLIRYLRWVIASRLNRRLSLASQRIHLHFPQRDPLKRSLLPPPPVLLHALMSNREQKFVSLPQPLQRKRIRFLSILLEMKSPKRMIQEKLFLNHTILIICISRKQVRNNISGIHLIKQEGRI